MRSSDCSVFEWQSCIVLLHYINLSLCFPDPLFSYVFIKPGVFESTTAGLVQAWIFGARSILQLDLLCYRHLYNPSQDRAGTQFPDVCTPFVAIVRRCSEASQFANFGDNLGASSFTTCGAVSYSKQKVGSVVTMFVETRHVGICKVQVNAMLKNQNNRTRWLEHTYHTWTNLELWGIFELFRTQLNSL